MFCITFFVFNFMKTFRQHQYQGVSFGEFGYAKRGKPFINVRIYYLDGLIIDTGQSMMREEILTYLQDKKIEQILLTHHHEDHTGNVKVIYKAHEKPPVYAGEETGKLIQTSFPIKTYQKNSSGPIDAFSETLPLPETIQTSKYILESIFTPGHSHDHYAFYERSQGWLFSGDLYLGKIKFMRNDENIADMILSIRKVLELDFEVLFCAHHPRLENGKKHMQAKLDYLEDYWGTVLKLHKKGMKPVRILKEMNIPRMWMTYFMTGWDVSPLHMVNSVIENQERIIV